MFAEYKPYSLKIKNIPYSITRPQVMGILNTTDDSFYDGGKYHTIDKALFRCEDMLHEGADIIDIGGQSTRPGADIITENEEIRRTAPVIDAIIKRFPDCIISIDTFRAAVANHAVRAGAAIINDVSAGDDDEDMVKTVSRLQVPYIAMHKKGLPKTMQDQPHYENVLQEVKSYLENKVRLYRDAGIEDIVLDPGFGFGKTLDDNYHLLKHLDVFHTLNCPILVGVSRKSMVWKLLSSEPSKALNGSTALHMLALAKGAHFLRVHDVKEAVDCVKIAEEMYKV
jgi:dihydropteroate synthase